MKYKTFNDWFSKVNFKKTAYFASELMPLLELCWIAARPIKKMTRSLKQNAYMWGVVYDIMSKEIGYETKEIHQLMGKQFLSYENKGKMFIKSTTELKTNEMEKYLADVRKFASEELRIGMIPLPNETEFNWTVK